MATITHPPVVAKMDAEWRCRFDELAAWFEYDQKHNRPRAEQLALVCLMREVASAKTA